MTQIPSATNEMYMLHTSQKYESFVIILLYSFFDFSLVYFGTDTIKASDLVGDSEAGFNAQSIFCLR